ncbi:MAG: hypothetical protein HOJ15_00020 [Candidatus Jacksonbacteria bacterium]|nr:hypothetical protein [Candidatus Jacksonbacteria bacterium]MBT6300803.1 hypothetical protein [Candidatus Jacksonbacteria bacterium]
MPRHLRALAPLLLVIAVMAMNGCAAHHQQTMTHEVPTAADAIRYESLDAAIAEIEASEPPVSVEAETSDEDFSLTPEQRAWLRTEALAWLNEAKHMLATEQDHQVYLDWREHVDETADDWGIDRDKVSYAEAHRLLDCAIADIEADNFRDEPGFGNELRVTQLALYAKWHEEAHADSPEEWNHQLPRLSEGAEDLWTYLNGPEEQEPAPEIDWEGLSEGWPTGEETTAGPVELEPESEIVAELRRGAAENPKHAAELESLANTMEAFEALDRLVAEGNHALERIDDLQTTESTIDTLLAIMRGDILNQANYAIGITLIELGGVYRE